MMFFRLTALLTLSCLSLMAVAQSYKCQTADGKIEFSDRPCDTNAKSLTKPKADEAAAKPVAKVMDKLVAVFAEFEPRLCEREKLAAEVQMAHRSGEIKKAPEQWKAKQNQLSDLNDALVEFQEKASKLIAQAGNDSDESRALRKFQAKLKDCSKLAP
ncbi:MAG: DUF4124 domain-containing protein [Betaproteobacteria bacterium]|nr:DUF4124 domain-containing protein [Betaproteobacteria bacterium]